MVTRRSRAKNTMDVIKLAQVLGQAWSAADAIQRRYPRLYAAAVARAMDLEPEQAAEFIDLMEAEHVGIERQKHTRGGFR